MKRETRISLRKVAAGFLVLAMALAACNLSEETAGQPFSNANQVGDGGGEGYSAGGEDASTATTAAAASAESPQDEDGAAEPLDAARIAAATFTPADFGRDIIFTADMTIAVTDVAAASAEATRVIESLGGYLFGQTTRGAPEARSVLTFKVQPSDFQEALARLGAIGEVRAQDVSANDVTERIVDLESQIQTASASVERLRALLAAATDIKTVVELENELLARETQLESLRGTLRTLENQVALATISVVLTEAESRPAISLAVTSYPGHDDGLGCPGDPELSIEQDTEATVCYEIINSGDTLLVDFELRDPVLDIETSDLVVVYGDPSVAIEPGESIVVAAEITVERSVRTRTTVTAQPVDEDGNALGDRSATQTTSSFIQAVDPGGIPTFTEGLTASLDWLAALGQLLLLIAGAVLPFFWIPLILWLAWRMWRTKKTALPAGTGDDEL